MLRFAARIRAYTSGMLLIVLSISLFPSFAFAQQQIGVKVTPPLIEERIDPKSTLNYSIDVQNESDTEDVFYPRVRDILGIDADGAPLFAKDGEKADYALSSWVTFAEKSIKIGAHDRGKLHFTVTVPADVTPGAHVGAVSVSRNPPDTKVLGSTVGYEVATIVSLRVSGEVVENVQLREFLADKALYDSPQVTMKLRVENLGNVFARPRGFVDITNMFGRKVISLPVNDGGASVFPKSERIYTVKWDSKELEIGHYTAELALSVEGSKGMQTLPAKVQFWVIPSKIVLPTLGGLLSALLVFYVLLRVYVRKQIMRATGGRMPTRRQEASSLSRLSVVVIALVLSVLLAFLLLFIVLG